MPDGGLTEGLPDWLRRPPAWRNLPRREAGTDPEITDGEPALPDPDTSVIDPRTLVDVADLPEWLQQIAARGEKPALDSPETIDQSMQESKAMQPDDQDRDQISESEERTVDFEPVDKKKWEVSQEKTKVYGGGPPKAGMSLQIMLMLGVIVLAIILIVLILTL